MAAGFLESRLPKRGIKAKTEMPFYDPAETHHHFYFILLIKSESLTPGHTQGEQEGLSCSDLQEDPRERTCVSAKLVQFTVL